MNAAQHNEIHDRNRVLEISRSHQENMYVNSGESYERLNVEINYLDKERRRQTMCKLRRGGNRAQSWCFVICPCLVKLRVELPKDRLRPRASLPLVTCRFPFTHPSNSFNSLLRMSQVCPILRHIQFVLKHDAVSKVKGSKRLSIAVIHEGRWCPRFSTAVVRKDRSSTERCTSRTSITNESSQLSTLRGGCGQVLISSTLVSLSQGLLLGLNNEDVLVRGLSSTVEDMTARERSAPIKGYMLDLISLYCIVSACHMGRLGMLLIHLPYSSSVRRAGNSVCAPWPRVKFCGGGA
jgi:hypothetical protein